MALVFDRAVAGPATHAIVIGVSDYTFLPGPNDPPDPKSFKLKRLASPALSASRVADWLMRNADLLARPLASCRLLLSPSSVELPQLALTAVPGSTGAAPAAATWMAFVSEMVAWRDAAAQDPTSLAVFYFAGHGLQKLGAPLLALADFLDPSAGGRLMHSVELSNITSGMTPSADRPAMAQSQLYFIDACREEVDASALSTNAGSVFDGLSGRDVRSATTFQATYSGDVAQAIAGNPTDFCNALLAGLENGAENRDASDPLRRWPVTTFTLHRAITNYFAGLKTGQFAPINGPTVKDETLRWLIHAPPVELSVSIDPQEAVECTSVALTGAQSVQQPAQPGLHPYRLPLTAGIYHLVATPSEAAYSTFSDDAMINQANARWIATVSAR